MVVSIAKKHSNAQDWENQTPSNAGIIAVHAAEAYQLNDGAVYARYYAEGVVPDGNDGVRPYRTRVTGVWVKEGKNWVAKTMHFPCCIWGNSPNGSRTLKINS